MSRPGPGRIPDSLPRILSGNPRFPAFPSFGQACPRPRASPLYSKADPGGSAFFMIKQWVLQLNYNFDTSFRFTASRYLRQMNPGYHQFAAADRTFDDFRFADGHFAGVLFQKAAQRLFGCFP